MVASLAQDIFKELAQIEGCQGPMQTRLIPTLVSIMQAPPDKIPSGLCAVSSHRRPAQTFCCSDWLFLIRKQDFKFQKMQLLPCV